MLSAIASVLFYPLKLSVFLFGHLYFKQIKIKGKKNLPSSGPVILAINHQNALLDALLINGFFWRNTFFITRGDIFNPPFLSKILRGFKMLPIYRLSDGYHDTRRNDATFETGRKKLLKGRVLGIFPEGSHNLLYKIRPLKKGVAHLAFMAEESANFSSGLSVVPVGIQYDSHFGPGRTLISIGEPIKISKFREVYYSDPNLAFKQLLRELSDKMKRLVVDINGDYDEIYKLFTATRIFRNNICDQLSSDQALVQALEHHTPLPQVNDKVPLYKKIIDTIWQPLWIFIGFLPKFFVDMLVRKYTHDPHYFGTMRFIYSMFIYPAFFLILGLAIRFFLL